MGYHFAATKWLPEGIVYPLQGSLRRAQVLFEALLGIRAECVGPTSKHCSTDCTSSLTRTKQLNLSLCGMWHNARITACSIFCWFSRWFTRFWYGSMLTELNLRDGSHKSMRNRYLNSPAISQAPLTLDANWFMLTQWKHPQASKCHCEECTALGWSESKRIAWRA